MTNLEKNSNLFAAVKEIVRQARTLAYKSSNSILLKMYWEIGNLIVEHEQQGRAKAEYGKQTLKKLAEQLTFEFGAGFDERNLNNMRAFYSAFPIWNAVRSELSWTHYRMISRIESESQRLQYVELAIEGNWDTRTLQRNIGTQYVERILKPEIEPPSSPQNFLKDPYIFEFLGLAANAKLTESDLETALINHLQQFLMELGKGFAFVGRQQHIVTDTSDFFIDLVFYNYHLKCFALIDLKIGRLTHHDIGQMDMYVRMYDDLKRIAGDNPTIGLILCTEKDETIVKYSVLAENEQLFAAKYRLYLPTEAELVRLIETDRINFELDQT